MDNALLGLYRAQDADRLDKLETESLAARARLEEAIQKNYSESVTAAFRQAYIDALGRQVGFQKTLELRYKALGNYDFSLKQDSLLSPKEIAKINASPLRDLQGKEISNPSNVIRYAVARGASQQTLAKLRKKVQAADAVNRNVQAPEGWTIESPSVTLDAVQNGSGSRAVRNALMLAKLGESKYVFYGTVLKRPGSAAIVRFQHSDGALDATPAEIQTTVDAIKAMEDAGINLNGISGRSLFTGSAGSLAATAEEKNLAPFTVDVGSHGRGAGFTDTSTIAFASSTGVVKVKLSKTRAYDSETHRREQAGHHAVEAVNGLDSLFNTVIHELGHIVHYRSYSDREFQEYKSAGLNGKLNLIDGPDKVGGRYNEKNGAEHWAEALVEFVRRNKISPRMRELLVTRGILLK